MNVSPVTFHNSIFSMPFSINEILLGSQPLNFTTVSAIWAAAEEGLLFLMAPFTRASLFSQVVSVNNLSFFSIAYEGKRSHCFMITETSKTMSLSMDHRIRLPEAFGALLYSTAGITNPLSTHYLSRSFQLGP
jgi:hypothetical protein